ncbi:DUF7847 domain-containing protein [Natronorubrum texcoconense]|uniref:Membrane domain of glycerophosphoryl diester phosphodiesterase n=1 Tax=Natronorubrum texcoconense TaxID=1095776 RepID=A0A1G8UI79_9EURY|nr:glycerophosphoryl diester phosphodiesterase membrane domain-containing protein [Natronorubrum texcoconense]SDJ53502.1 Membrane domain of glycerophosphoryl diester phosphodiesterase [Natronorubrum texcoconense]
MPSLQRKGVIGSIGDGIEWLRRNPILMVVFLLYGLIELGAEILGPAGVVLTLVGWLLLPYIDGLVHVIGKQEASGESGDIGRASSTVLGRYLSLIVIWIAYVIAVSIGLIFLILPGIYLAVRLSLAFPACVIDDQDAFESLSTSWSVAKGNLLKLFGIFVASLVVVGSVGIVTVLYTGLDGEFYLTFLLVSALLTAVVSPVVQFALARVYLENRPTDETSTSEDDTQNDGWGTTTDDRTRTNRDDDRWDDANW